MGNPSDARFNAIENALSRGARTVVTGERFSRTTAARRRPPAHGWEWTATPC